MNTLSLSEPQMFLETLLLSYCREHEKGKESHRDQAVKVVESKRIKLAILIN